MIQFGADFSILGAPEAGLTPTIEIRDTSDGSIVINGAAVPEVGNGAYRYDFTNDTTKKYRAIIDGGLDTLDSRYFTAWSERAKAESEIARILTATEVKQCVVTDAAATSLSFETDLTETDNPFWKRGVILMTSGANAGQIRAILSYNGTTKQVTLKTPLNGAPANLDTFIILAERKYLTPDIEDIIAATWDELLADHLVAGSFGANMTYLKKIINNKKSLEKTGAVWELVICDDDNVTAILRKELKDSAGDNITDLAAGILAQEIKNSI